MCNLADEIEEDGVAKGIAKGKVETLVSLVLDGIITKEEAAKRAEMTEKEFDEVLAKLQK